MRLTEIQRRDLGILRVCLKRLRYRIGMLKLRTTADRVRQLRMERGQAVLEARVAELRGQEHLSAVPLLCEPLFNGHSSFAQMDDSRDAVISFLAPDRLQLDESGEAGFATHRLAFYKVARFSANEEIHHWHRRQFRRKGHVRSRAFYEVRNSRTLKSFSTRKRAKLTHWVFYLDRLCFEVIAVEVVPLREYALRRLDAPPR